MNLSRNASIFTFTTTRDGELVVKAKNDVNATVVRESGFYYTMEMNRLSSGHRHLILGGGIGWQAYHLSAVLSERSPTCQDKFSITSVEKDLGMFEHTIKSKSFVNISFVHDDAFDFIVNTVVDRYDTIFIDMFENSTQSVLFAYDQFKNLFDLSDRVVVHLITKDDILRYLGYGKKMNMNMLLVGELFGTHSSDLVKNISLSSSGGSIVFDNSLTDRACLTSDRNRRMFVSPNSIYNVEIGTYPLEYVMFYGQKL